MCAVEADHWLQLIGFKIKMAVGQGFEPREGY